MTAATDRDANTTTIAGLLAQATTSLQGDSPRLDAEVLLAHALDKPRSHLHAWPEREPTTAQRALFADLLARRRAGEPVAHLTGRREFWSLDLRVTPDTLIPRPETETLVARALALIPADADWHIADLGTGSGAVALALASERPRCRVVATDRDQATLAVATANAQRLGLDAVRFYTGDWCAALPMERFDVIVSNPPYIADNDPHLARGDVRFEPRRALAAGPRGLDDLAAIAGCAPNHLAPGGWLLLEHGFDQGELSQQLLEQAGFSDISDCNDEAGQPRVVSGRLPC